MGKTPKAKSSKGDFERGTVKEGNGGGIHWRKMDKEGNAEKKVVEGGAERDFDEETKLGECLGRGESEEVPTKRPTEEDVYKGDGRKEGG